MKYSITQISLLVAFSTGLTACGGGNDGGGSGGGGGAVSTYNGTWKGACETVGTRSFKQTWELNGTSLKNDVKVWRTNASCQSGTVTPVVVKAGIEYKDEVSVANTCSGGKAQPVDVTYKSLKANGVTITGEQNIQNILTSQGISDALPKYGLICKGDDGKL
ncbi:MAG TPA: hypothetical protein EYH20_00060, partial [Leucothrix sp.]|nr:hypothetical protein [Leucothrix sp.]